MRRRHDLLIALVALIAVGASSGSVVSSTDAAFTATTTAGTAFAAGTVDLTDDDSGNISSGAFGDCRRRPRGPSQRRRAGGLDGRRDPRLQVQCHAAG